MRRSALRLFIERLIMASLPLVAVDCKSGPKAGTDAAIADAAVRDAAVTDLATATAPDLRPPDLAVPPDLRPAIHDAAAPEDLSVPLLDGAARDAAPLDGPAAPIDANLADAFPSDPICSSPPAPLPPDFMVKASDCVGALPCEWFVEIATPPATVTDGGDIDPSDCFTVCRSVCRPYGGWACAIDGVSCAGNAIIRCEIGCGAGRLPPRVAFPREPDAGHAGRFFARMAWLEAASVDAFLQLADELTTHRAPAALVRAALRAAGDERRHARAATRLARRYGATVPAACSARVAPRPLAEVAADNAVEGCVRETWGALVATWQGRSAGDTVVRRAMQAIATDETRHAELGWAVARWAEPQLPQRTRRAIQAARVAAADSLLAEAERAPAAELVLRAGLPDRPQARHLAATFAESIRSGLDLA